MDSTMLRDAPDGNRVGPVPVAGSALVVIGMQMFIIQPAFVSLFVTDLGLSEAAAGYVASAEMAGIALATIVAAAVERHLPMRRTATLATLLLIAANVASALAPSFAALLGSRTLAGIGSGLLISLGYAIVGGARDTERSFALCITAVLLYSAVIILALPTAAHVAGTPALFAMLAALTAAFFAVRHAIPASASPAGTDSPARPSATFGVGAKELAALGAVALFFLCQGLVWAYLGLIGLSHGIGEQAVNNGLTVSQLTGIAGALSFAALAARMRLAIPLAAGCIASSLALLALIPAQQALFYTSSVTVFNFVANLLTPMLMAIAARMGGGRLIRTAAALQMIGLALGPSLSARLVEGGSYTPVLVIGAAMSATVLVLGLFALARRSSTDNAVAVPTDEQISLKGHF